MPDDTPDTPSKGKLFGKGASKEPADQKRREQILVGAAIMGVILTVVLIRRSSSAAAGTVASATPSTPASGTDPGIDPNTGQAYSTELASLQSQLSSLNLPTGGTSSPTGISSTPNPSPGYASAGAPATGSASLGFATDTVPVQVSGNTVIDTGTGRPAYFGPSGQPGYGSPQPGTKSWLEPQGPGQPGRQVWYPVGKQ